MFSIFDVLKILLFFLVLIFSTILGYYFYGIWGAIVALIPSIFVGFLFGQTLIWIASIYTKKYLSEKSIQELEEIIISRNYPMYNLIFLELKKRDVNLDKYRYLVEELYSSNNESERYIGERLKENFY